MPSVPFLLELQYTRYCTVTVVETASNPEELEELLAQLMKTQVHDDGHTSFCALRDLDVVGSPAEGYTIYGKRIHVYTEIPEKFLYPMTIKDFLRGRWKWRARKLHRDASQM